MKMDLKIKEMKLWVSLILQFLRDNVLVLSNGH